MGATTVAPQESSGVENIVQVQLFTDLLNPFFNALGGQFWLTVFVNRQTHEVIVVCQTFRRFEVITSGRPVTYNNGTVWLNNVADGAQRITEVLCIIFLVAAAKQGNQLAVEIHLFQRWEEIIPVTLASP